MAEARGWSMGLRSFGERTDISGGRPYGATTIAASDGSRQPSANELDGARYQGRHVAQIAARLAV